jgi:hypothetical protein
MANRFMMSVAAAALIAGTGFAYAQGTGTSRDAPSGGSAVQQNAPSTGNAGGPAQINRDAAEPKGPSSGMKASQSDQKLPSDQKSPGGAKNQRAQDDMKAGTKGEKSADDNMKQDNMKGDRSKSMSSETNEKGAAGKDRDMKAEGREGRNDNMNAETKGGAADSRTQTTGQVGGGARLSGEQRTRISTVFRDQRIEPLNNVNFSIAVGSRVPRDISFHPLPAEVVTIYPEWRGYEFVRVRDQILVINPRTLEIVAVLEA